MKLFLAAFAFLGMCGAAYAQAPNAQVVPSCGSGNFHTGVPGAITIDPTGTLCDSGSSSTAPTYTSPVPLAPVASTTTESSHVVKASAGSLSSLTITLGSTSGWLMLFDATSAPADGPVTPVYALPVSASGYAAISWPAPLKFSTGITAVFSSTGPFTKTASATAAFFGQVQ